MFNRNNESYCHFEDSNTTRSIVWFLKRKAIKNIEPQTTPFFVLILHMFFFVCVHIVNELLVLPSTPAISRID